MTNKSTPTAAAPTNQLYEIKAAIESMEKYHQIEVLRILQEQRTKLNENNNGIFVNLSFVSEETLAKLREYIQYVRVQNQQLDVIENEKEQYRHLLPEDDTICLPPPAPVQPPEFSTDITPLPAAVLAEK